MAPLPQQGNPRSNKRPRQDDYPGDVGYSGGDGVSSSSTAFQTPRNLDTNGINQLAAVSDPSQYIDPTDLVGQSSWPYADSFSHFIAMDENGNNLPATRVADDLDYDQFLPGGFGTEALQYTYEPAASSSAPDVSSAQHESLMAAQWVVVPSGTGTDNSNPSSSNSSLTPCPPPSARWTKSGPSEQEWEERKPLIVLLYGPEKTNLNLTLPELMRVMGKAGFLVGASQDMYKNKFFQWGITKNEMKVLSHRRARKQQRETAKACQASFMSNEARITAKDMFDNMRSLCVESVQQTLPGIWSLGDEFCVVDDDWEDAYGSAADLIDELAEKPDSTVGWDTIRPAVTPMVETLNYFSLPTILIIAFKMCKRLVDPKVRRVVGDFLGGCLETARAASQTSSRHVSLASILQGLSQIAQQQQQEDDLDSLADILELTIPCYIQLVNNQGNSESATALSLLAFYHVQLRSDQLWLDSTLGKIMALLERAEAARGQEDKATIEIMGLAIMVLQRTEHDKMLKQLASKMRLRTSNRLRELPRNHPDHLYFLHRMLDVYHLEIRLTKKDGDAEYVDELKREYERLQAEHQKEKDGYAKILDREVEGLASQLQGTPL